MAHMGFLTRPWKSHVGADVYHALSPENPSFSLPPETSTFSTANSMPIGLRHYRLRPLTTPTVSNRNAMWATYVTADVYFKKRQDTDESGFHLIFYLVKYIYIIIILASNQCTS